MFWSYRPALDGLRTVAVYLVLLFHTGMSVMAGGFVGVDLFFVLSGFLVTNVILSEIDETGRLSLGSFYARRVRRLLPAAVVVVAATAVVYVLVFPVASRLSLVGDARSALLYYANWNFLLQQNDYFATGVTESPFLHFWSLAIEEQFYIVFPVLLVLLARAAHRWSGAMLGALTALLLLSLGSQLYWAGVDPNWAYYGTDARLYQLLAGAVLAVALRTLERRPSARAAGATAVVGLGALLVVGTALVDVSPSTRGILATVASVTVVAALMAAPDGLLGRILALPIPVYLGKISYGTYLWHWPVILVLEQVLTVRPLVLAGLATVVSTSLAALSFTVLEHPVRAAASLRRFRWRVVVAGVATSALVAVAVVPPLLEDERRPRLAVSPAASTPMPSAPAAPESTTPKVTAKERSAPVPQDIDWEDIQNWNEDRPLCTPEDPEACVLVRGSGPHIMLIGDSYGRVFLPAFIELAKKHDLTLSHNTVPRCSWQSELVLKRMPESALDNCLAQRNAWYDEVLPQLDVDVAVLTTMDRDGVRSGDGSDPGHLVRLGGSDETVPELLYATTRDTVKQITDAGPRAVIFESLPRPGKLDPLECLGTATSIGQCAVPLRDDPPSDAYIRTVASMSEDVFSVDLALTFCHGAPHCLPVVDGVVTWSDSVHLTPEVALLKKDQVWREIVRTGALEGMRDTDA